MKKILLLVVAVLFVTTLFAENVDQTKAKKVAKAFAAQRDKNAAQQRTDIVYSHPMPNTKDAAFYVVNLGETGFVIVSANDVAHPVLGYSFDSLFKCGNYKGIGGRIYATASNVFCITKYSGIDPEVFGGIDNNLYPRPISFILGLNLNF